MNREDLGGLPRKAVARACCAPAILALLSMLSVNAWAQRLPMRLYTTEDGLWSGFINSLMRDSHGFLWFCTRDGLSRFDGYRFANYKIAGGTPSQNFEFMYESRGGVFWLELNGKSLYRYTPGSVSKPVQPSPADLANDDGRVLLHAELVTTQLVDQMLQGRDGNLWVGGEGLFLVEENAGRFSFREIDLHLPHEWKQSFRVHGLVEGSDGSLWMGTIHGLLRRLPDGRVVQYGVNRNRGPEDVRVRLADKHGNIWATHPRGLFVLKPELVSTLAGSGGFSSRRLTPHPPTLKMPMPTQTGEAIDLTAVTSGGALVYQHSNGQMWFVTPDGLVLFDGRQFRSFADSRGAFGDVTEDSDGDLWIITSLGGAVRFSVRGLVSYNRSDGLGSHEIDWIQEGRDRRLYAVSAGWWISRFDDGKFKSIRPKIPDGGRLWTSNLGFLDHTGLWWLLTSRGLYRYRRREQFEDLPRVAPRLYTKLDGLPGQWPYCMFEDSRGDLWISMRGYEFGGVIGLVRWRRSDETFHKLTQADGLPPMKSAASFAEDRAGNLWFGFYEGGLARYAAGRFASFTAADGLPEGFITALKVDHLGRLWLTSSSGGLARIDDPTASRPKFVHYTTREGLSSNNARALTEDLSGDIYVGTVRGVDRLTPETGKIKHYGPGDGLAADFVTTAYRDRDGTLWFGTFAGLSRLDPQPEPAPAAPSIRIEGLRFAGVKQPLSEYGTAAIRGLELSSAQSNLQIDFSSLSMARAALLRYQYQLQGVDRDWSAPTDQRTVHYANLAPGRYRFLVRAVDPSGLSSAQPARVEFRIFPPFWQRWWFLALAAMALGSAFALSYRYRVGHLLELERVRTHIATDLHDDIGSSLSQIAVLSEVVRSQVDGTAALSQPLSTIASTAREVVDSMSDIVWAINPHRDNLGDLAHRMRRFASDLFTANNIDFRFNALETERPIKLDADVRRQVFLIFKESVHNIVRHSKCANVAVDLQIENHAISLTLKDDGKGFDPAHASHGHGLTSMTRRAKTLGGALVISSQLESGATVSLKVPLARRVAAR